MRRMNLCIIFALLATGLLGFVVRAHLGSIWNIPYISTYGVSFRPLICGYNSLKSYWYEVEIDNLIRVWTKMYRSLAIFKSFL